MQVHSLLLRARLLTFSRERLQRVLVIGCGITLHSLEETLLYRLHARADPLAADVGSVSAAVEVPCVTRRSLGLQQIDCLMLLYGQ